jgi:hypothetical protein
VTPSAAGNRKQNFIHFKKQTKWEHSIRGSSEDSQEKQEQLLAATGKAEPLCAACRVQTGDFQLKVKSEELKVGLWWLLK